MNEQPRCGFNPALSLAIWSAIFFLSQITVGQGLVDPNQSIAFGEFPTALENAAAAQGPERDLLHAKIAEQQFRGGAYRGMWTSAGKINDDRIRSRTYRSLGDAMRQTPARGNDGPQGNRGGITIGDFQPLMQLIQQTIAPDEWTTTQGEGTIQPYVTGVYVNGAGEVRRVNFEHSKTLQSAVGNQRRPGGTALGDAEIRQVSLIQLERNLQSLAAQGKPIPEALQNLAGIYDLQYLIVDRENKDILIAGPAGPWRVDAEGVNVNVKTGRPVLQLSDLVTCLRSVWFDGGRFGCAITPRQQNLASAQEFLRTTSLRGDAFRRDLQKAVGMQDIEVFGIDPNSSTARVLLEADYRMKLVGMGLEPSIPAVPSYFQEALKTPEAAQSMDVARWWFTLNYDGIATDENRTIFELKGTGVKVLSETEMLGEQGQRIHTNQSQGPTKLFAENFTKHFDQLAEQYPVYNQLRNVFDLAMVCSLIRREGLAKEVNWNLTYFGRSSSGSQFLYQEQPSNVAKVVESVMNSEAINFSKGGKKFRQTIIGVSGGIDCPVSQLVDSTRYQAIKSVPELATVPRDESLRWWWD
jgi:hypothetical protein